jgi:DNA-binding response OmpR family regulator
MTESAATVLVIDDAPILLETLALHLEQEGYQVRRAEDGAKALEVLHDEPEAIDVIVSDVTMPVMDGYALCEQVKHEEATNTIPFIFISSLTDLDEKLKGYAVGGHDYIVKPVAPEEMLDR